MISPNYRNLLVKTAVNYRKKHAPKGDEQAAAEAEMQRLAQGMQIPVEQVRTMYNGEDVPDPYKRYTVKQVAKRLNLSAYMVNYYITKGKLKAVKVLGRWRIAEKHLQEFIAARQN